jgi:hypothetical protein
LGYRLRPNLGLNVIKTISYYTTIYNKRCNG